MHNNTHSHSNMKPVTCDTCGAKLSCNSKILTHIRTHTGKKPFKCDTCGDQFSQRDTLKIHVLTHVSNLSIVIHMVLNSHNMVF